MLLGLKELNKLEIFLDSLLEKKEIYKYRIYLNLNTTISVDIVADENDEIRNQIENSGLVDISIDEWIDKSEYENDEYYQRLFEKKIDKEHRRRLINLIDNSEDSKKNDVPVITFYSYKGGVGRTTALITFANYYAYHYRKKVVILDFDFEAPGFTNYFDFSLDALNNKSGVLEYILDKEASKEKLNLLQNYMIEVSNEYSGDGSIYVMPSGNLFGQKNLESYIEALARIDINSTDTITNQILGLINDINKTLNPDVILIDSRTGFNDVFGFLINRISNTIVGLFEGNKQTEPGMKLFLNEIYKEEYKNSINAILVNSLVHKDSGYSKRLKEFSKNVNNYLIELTDENYAPEIFDLRKSNILGNLGTTEDDKDDYFEFIKESTPNDYKKFFDKVIESIEFKKKDNKSKKIIPVVDSTSNNKSTSISQLDIEELKTNLLTKIYDNFPKNYAEDIIYNNDFLNKQFYFRKSMEDIFNFDKFLLIGTKGTGKTAFFSALKSSDFVDNLRKKANKNKSKFQVIDIISLKQDKNKEKYFEVKNFNQNNIEDKEFFYKRFWTIYILNSILLDRDKIKYIVSKEISKLLPQKLIGSVENKNLFEEIINNDKEFILIETELKKINIHLKKHNINLMITFDQLDYIVKPALWSEIVSPLIDYCRSISYFQIQPKLFLRRDLFNKLTNLTNKKALDTKSINLEWSKEEIFAFFFKLIFAYTKDEFFEIMKRYNDFKQPIITKIEKQIEKKNSYNQINLDSFFIETLVETFFGKYPVPSNRSYRNDYAPSFDWFYDSLADANGTISLRPFLDLIKFAIDKFLSKNIKDINYDKPILHPNFYNNKNARRKCIENYFEDLSNEEGNEDFKTIIEHIRDSSKFPNKFKHRRISGDEYNKFFNYFLENTELLYSKTINDIEDVLRLNGAISIHYIHDSKKAFNFAYLYKYYLNLRG